MRILYVTHTDWNWIKQRSHYLSEEFQKWAYVDIRYKYSLKRWKLLRQPIPGYCRGVLCIPFRLQTWAIVRSLDRAILRTYYRWLTSKKKYDVIIITHPLLLEYVRGFGKVIYDLHDDNEEFYNIGCSLRRLISKKNMDAIAETKAVVVSSRWLYDKYASKAVQTVIIRNGHNVSETNVEFPQRESISGTRKKIFYFGTISKWFDIELVQFSLERVEDIEYHIIGPCDVPLFEHDRVKYYGPLQHEVMLEISRNADGFIMPFYITPLIEGVDPLKLYEYIALSKPILVPYYQEIEYFSTIVNIYHNKMQYLNLLRALCNGRLRSVGENERNTFLRANTWSIRGQAYAGLVDRVISS